MPASRRPVTELVKEHEDEVLVIWMPGGLTLRPQ